MEPQHPGHYATIVTHTAKYVRSANFLAMNKLDANDIGRILKHIAEEGFTNQTGKKTKERYNQTEQPSEQETGDCA